MNRPLRNTGILLLIVYVLAGLTGCSTAGYMKKPERQASSIVFGYIDMDDAPTSLEWISMKQLQPHSDKPYYHLFVDDGLFYMADVPAGTYKFWKFGGHSGWKNTDYTFSFPYQGKGEMDRRIGEQGVYFAGCYKYKKIKTSIFKPGKFDLLQMDASCEKEMLVRLGKWSKHPEWNQLISRRLAELQPVAGRVK